MLVAVVAWLTVMVLSGVNAAKPFLQDMGVTVGLSLVVAIVQLLFTLIFVTPLWRKIWRWIPRLNEWVYPDLNGDWRVELESNYPRIDALVSSARGDAPPLDVKGEPSMLPALGKHTLRARIRQSWAEIEIELWDPTATGPIEESKTSFVEPFRRRDWKHGLAYIFEQTNRTDVVSDDRKFHGAGWVQRERDDPDALTGRIWTDRMWRQGMNTAAEVRFIRLASNN